NGSTYYVTITLPNGCSATSDTATILTKSVAIVDVITNASCAGADGSILATVTSGLPPYQYIWSTDLAQTNIVRNVTKASNKDTLLNLSAGTYYLQVYDEAGQPGSCNSGVLTFVVSGSNPIVATVSGTNISCNGFADGSATVSWTGGTSPFTILWSDGFTTASRSVFAGGTLTVIVSDQSGCADTASVTINEPAALALSLSSTPETAPGALNGTATALASGGTPGYLYDWFDAGFTPVGSGSTVGGLAGGTYYYCLVTDTNGCQFNDTIGVITNVITNATLNLTALLEGYHNGTGGMVPALLNSGVGVSATETDTIRVELRDALSPVTVIGSGTAVISTGGQASFSFPSSVIGNSYYIAVFHRNAVQTWSALPVTFSASTSYDFSSGAGQAYGSNMIAVLPGVYAFYSGDLAPQDEFIDILDQAVIDNDIFNFASGYVISDLNGDGFVDIIDQAIVDNNIFNFIGSVHP
ncbi:MAG: SprB repeat-containing protein, partial [Bacteroidia bacterium]|nr:SprB repeat-containing protein [Bacteroidia bacterium]